MREAPDTETNERLTKRQFPEGDNAGKVDIPTKLHTPTKEEMEEARGRL